MIKVLARKISIIKLEENCTPSTDILLAAQKDEPTSLTLKKKNAAFWNILVTKKHYTFFPCLACNPTGHSEMLALSSACPGRAEQ